MSRSDRVFVGAMHTVVSEGELAARNIPDCYAYFLRLCQRVRGSGSGCLGKDAFVCWVGVRVKVIVLVRKLM